MAVKILNMAATLFFSKNHHLSLFYELNFVNYLGQKVDIIEEDQALVQNLNSPGNVKLFIIEEESLQNDTLEKFEKEKLLAQPAAHVIYLGKNTPTGPTVFQSTVSIKDVLQKSAEIFGVTAKKMASQVKAEYIPMDIKYLRVCEHAPVDIYQHEGAIFELVLDKDQGIPARYWKEVDSKGRSHVHIKSRDRLKFTNIVTDAVINVLQKQRSITSSEADEVSFEVLQQYMDNAGFDENAVKMASRTIKLIEKTIAASKEPVMVLMKKVIGNKQSYIYSKSQLISYLSSHVLEHISWGSKDHQKKMIYSAFFHDVALVNHEHAKIRNGETLEKYGFNDKEKESILTHALKASKVIRKVPGAPMGCDVIIKQHHGSRDGIGLPDVPAKNLAPLSSVFYICDTLSHEILTSGNFDLGELLDQLIEQMKPNKAISETFHLLRCLQLGSLLG